MNSKTTHSFHRFFQALLAALMLMAVAAAPAYAQDSRPADSEPVRIQVKSGWTAVGIHSVADDFVLVCPDEPLADPDHPCNNERNSAGVRFDTPDDLVLVCPLKEVLHPDHPCHGRGTSAGLQGSPDDLVLVCPILQQFDSKHPCNESSSAIARFEIPNDYALVCPVKEVLDPNYPCFDN